MAACAPLLIPREALVRTKTHRHRLLGKTESLCVSRNIGGAGALVYHGQTGKLTSKNCHSIFYALVREDKREFSHLFSWVKRKLNRDEKKYAPAILLTISRRALLKVHVAKPAGPGGRK